MKDENFWNKSNNGSIRQKIADFIDNNPCVSHLKNKKYYDFEDSLVNFIYENRELIAKEVDLEYQRDDFITQAKEEFGEDIEEVASSLPIDVLDNMITQWQDSLGENDDYWENYWGELTNVLTDGGISPLVGTEEYSHDEILVYAAYLKEWYSDVAPEFEGQTPSCIDEFYDNEMSDEELREYYIKSAKKLFGDKFKGELNHI